MAEAKAAAPSGPKSAKPAGKWFVLVDTSIALQTYKSPKPNLLDNLRELGKHGDRIITTFILRDEFLRNRNSVMSELAPELKAKTPIPHFALNWPEGKAYLDAKAKSDEATKTLLANWQNALMHRDQDEVWNVVRAIFEAKSQLALTREHPEYRKHFDAARDRLALGNPPQKNRGDALGDPLNWEWALTLCAKHKANLVVLTADSDYSDGERDDDWIANAFLQDEFQRRVGADLIITSRTTRALEKIGEPITPEQKRNEADALVEVSSLDGRLRQIPVFDESGNFSRYLMVEDVSPEFADPALLDFWRRRHDGRYNAEKVRRRRTPRGPR